jgi:hypothetical protein
MWRLVRCFHWANKLGDGVGSGVGVVAWWRRNLHEFILHRSVVVVVFIVVLVVGGWRWWRWWGAHFEVYY